MNRNNPSGISGHAPKGPLPSSSPKSTDKIRALRIGVIGTGNHAVENLLPTLRLLSGVRITSLSSRSVSRLEHLGALYQPLHKTINWRELIDSANVDAIVVSATPQIHQEVMEYSIPRGIHTFVEKPPASDAPALAQLLSVVRHYPETIACVDYNFRFASGFQKVIGVLSPAGRIRVVKIRFVSRKPRRPLWSCKSLLQSFLYAVGIHAIDMALHVIGAPLAVLSNVTFFGDGALAIGVLLTTADGRTALLDLGNYSNRFECRFELVTETGVVGVLDDLRKVQFYPGHDSGLGRVLFEHKEVEEYTIPALNGGFNIGGYEGALSAFRDSIAGRQAPIASIEQSAPVYWVIQEICRACGDPAPPD